MTIPLERSILSVLDLTEAELLKACSGIDSSLIVSSARRLL
jgi:hypothetical protein